MSFTFHSLTELSQADFDTIIDVRSPAEFAEDHVPGAVSLPAVDDIHLLHQIVVFQIGVSLGDSWVVEGQETESVPAAVQPA